MIKRRTALSLPLLACRPALAALAALPALPALPAFAAAAALTGCANRPRGPSGPPAPGPGPGPGPNPAPPSSGGPAEGQHAIQLRVPGSDAPVRLWLYLPPGYNASQRRWPLVVFLHGSGERGTDIERVRGQGPPRLLAQGARPPCIVASPQLDEGQRWDPQRLHALLQVLQAQGRVDPDRVVATGLSLGGYGVWGWAAAFPRDLAAIAPVCGYGEAGAVCKLRQIPVRAYHGDADTVVPLALQQASVDALRACGGTVTFTVYPGVGHDSWTRAYADPELVPWMLRQQRRPA